MSSLDDLVGRAKMLLAEGHSPGQIADELSLSMETVTWLLTQGKGTAAPKDVHIDWTAVSSNATLLEETSLMLLQRFYGTQADENISSPAAGVIVGIALSGIPIATIIAVQEAAKLAIYHPAKQSQSEHPMGSISGNFAAIGGERCIIVDDTITSGNTMREVVKYLKKHHAVPVAIWVIFDKRGIKDMDGVPGYSLFRISRVD
jgi:orotate phosphoribosyltransferase